MTNSIEFGQI